MIQVHLRVLTSLSLSLSLYVHHFIVVDFWVVFDAVIESMELKTFLHVMVKNILRLKKEKKKRKKKSKLILNENYISAEIALNWLECPQLAEI